MIQRTNILTRLAFILALGVPARLTAIEPLARRFDVTWRDGQAFCLVNASDPGPGLNIKQPWPVKPWEERERHLLAWLALELGAKPEHVLTSQEASLISRATKARQKADLAKRQAEERIIRQAEQLGPDSEVLHG